MALIEVSGYVAGPPTELHHPLTGRPWADVTLATPSVAWAAGDSVELAVEDGPTYRMTVERVGQRGGFASVRLVGGTGGLSRNIEAKWYKDISVNKVVEELLEECGETIGDINLPGTLPAWLRPAGPAHEALRAVMMRYPDRVWQMDVEGRVSAGAPVWEDYPDPITIDHENAAAGLYTVAYTPALLPGQRAKLLRDGEELVKRVTRVSHSITEHYDYPRNRLEVRTVVGTGDGEDVGVAGLDAAVQRATRWTDYCALYPCEVLRDHGDHTLDLRPEHPQMPELTRVRLVLPVPGSRVKLRKGAMVLLAFQGGDPARPVVVHYGDGTLERLELKTGLGQTIVIDDDRGSASPEDKLYAHPRVLVRDAAGQSVELDATPGQERVTIKDKAGNSLGMDSASGDLTLKSKGGGLLEMLGSGAVTLRAAGLLTLEGSHISLGGDTPVARVGDKVTTPSGPGTIIGGSGKVGGG